MRVRQWRLEIDALAQEDIVEAARYLLDPAPEQYHRFRRMVNEAIKRIRSYPFLSPPNDDGLRHRATDVFRYNVWYSLDEKTRTVSILRVLHMSRDASALL